jgi:hypothetical protein
MIKGKTFTLTALVFCGVVFLTMPVSIVAQLIENRPNLTEKSTNTPKRNTTPKRPQVTKKQSKAETSGSLKKISRPKNPAVKTSYLAVTTEPGANIVLVSEKLNSTPIKRTAPDSGILEFDKLQPGDYSLSASLDGFDSREAELSIPPSDSLAFGFKLDAVKYQLSLQTNISEGEVRYAPARFVGYNADKSLKLAETGGYCIVPIRNNSALIKGMKKGYYTIDIRPKEVKYEPILAGVAPDNLDEEDENATETPESYKVNLPIKESTEQFPNSWTNSEWDLPTGWNLRNKLSTNGSSGIALPRSEQYRYYTDFEMIANVTLSDKKTAGFVFRAVDAQNYYLVQISGARAAEPYRVTGYVVKNGTAEQIFSNPIDNVASIVNKQFRLTIRGKDNIFKLYIEDSTTGDGGELGNMVDRFNNFRKGAVGIAGSANSNFEVVFFTVCYRSCQ